VEERVLELSHNLEKFINTSNPEFERLDPKQKALVHFLVNSGHEDVVKNLWRLVYDKKPPTIEEFLGPESLGIIAYSIYPYWKDKLTQDIFYPGSNVNEIIFTGCFTGETKISLLNGREVPIKDLVGLKDFWVYSKDINRNEIIPGRGHSCRKTKSNVSVLKITLDNGEYYRCTYDHLHLLKSGKYRRADKLKIGDSLSPLYRKVSVNHPWTPNGYELTLQPNGEWISTHRTVYHWKYGQTIRFAEIAHHKDFNKRNNEPKNILAVSIKNHNKYHGLKNSSPQGRERSRKIGLRTGPIVMKRLWSTPKFREDGLRRLIKKNKDPQFIERNRANSIANSKLAREKTIEFNRNHHPRLRKDITLDLIKSTISEHKDIVSSKCSHQLSNYLKCSVYFIQSFIFRETSLNIRDWFEHEFPDRITGEKCLLCNKHYDRIAQHMSLSHSNHRIVSIEPDGTDDVYDFEVDGQHNFAISAGVFVHNSTGGGKSFIARLCQLYNLVRVALMKYPQLMFNAAPSDLLSILFLSVSMSKADLAIIQPFIGVLRKCSYFQEVSKAKDIPEVLRMGKIPFKNEDYYLAFGKNIIAFIGSKETHAISMNLIGAIMDEGEFRQGTTQDAFDLYLTIRERLRNRFNGKANLMLNLVSSVKHDTGLIPQYISKLDKNDRNIRIYSPSVWEAKAEVGVNIWKDGCFYVMKGTRSIPSKILTEEETLSHEQEKFHPPLGCDVIKIPHKYYSDFNTGVDRALRNVAGVQTVADEQIFTSLDSFDNFDPGLTPELNIVAPLGSQVRLVDRLHDIVFAHYPTGKRLKRYPNVLRYAHIDLAETTEASVCIVHKEMGEGVEYASEVIVVDILLKITSPTRIDIETIQNLFIDLKNEMHVNFAKISCDRFQSAQLIQNLQKLNIAKKSDFRSIDRDIQQYYLLGKIVAVERLKIGQATQVREQCKHLKDRDGKTVTDIRKDMADTLCLDSETPIQLLDGTTPSIKTLYDANRKDFWVFSCDLDNKKIVPGLVREVKHNGKKKVIKIILDNGEYVKCTADHLVLTKEGVYKEAASLKIGESLMPLYLNNREYWNDTYKYFVSPFDQSSEFVYHMVASNLFDKQVAIERQKLDGSKYCVIHHKNHDKFNDDPSNLEYLTLKEHRKLHGNILVSYNKSLKKRYRNSQLIQENKIGFGSIPKDKLHNICSLNGTTNIKKYNGSERHITAISKDNLTTNGRRILSMQGIIHMQNLWKSNYDSMSKNSAENGRLARIRYNTSIEGRKKSSETMKLVTQWQSYRKQHNLSKNDLSFKNWKSAVLVSNHRIVGIQLEDKEVEVYDLVMDSYHNFAITSGIFVHNCGAVCNALEAVRDIPIDRYTRGDTKSVIEGTPGMERIV
jgi:intein/homing endonuclease